MSTRCGRPATSATAEGTLRLLPPLEAAGLALAVEARPFAPFRGPVQLQAAIHVARRAGLVEPALGEAPPELLHAVVGPDLRQAAGEHVADAEVGDRVHGGDATAGHHRAVGEDDRAVVELDAGLLARGDDTQLHPRRQFLAGDPAAGRGERPGEVDVRLAG